MIALCYRAAKSPNFCLKVPEKLTEIYFRVKPDEKEFGIENSTIPEVSLTEKAENGRANVQLKRKLAEITGEKPGIISGKKSRRKKLVFDQSEDKIREKIEEANN